MSRSDNIRGAVTMAAAMCAYTFNDTCIKLLSDDLPLGQTVFLRGIGTVVLMGVVGLLLGQLRFDLPGRDWWRILIRAVFETASAFFFLAALFKMPISNATAIMQSLPLTVALGAAIALREPIGWRRMTAILVGFVGVLLIIRPGAEGFNAYSLLVLCAVGSVTLRDLVVRKISADVPAMTVAFVAAIAVTIGFGVYAALFESWVAVTMGQGALLSVAVLTIVGGYILSVSAMRWGDIGFVAPFRYTAMIVGITLGMLVFGERPDALTFVGAAIVMATGIFTILRESRTRG